MDKTESKNTTQQIRIGGETPAEKKKEPEKKGFWAKLKSIKNIEIYLAIAAFAIIMLIYFSTNPLFKSNSNKTTEKNYYTSAYDYAKETEQRLSNILSTVKGAGKVEVMISFESTPERVIAYVVSNSTSRSSNGDNNYNENTQNTSSPQIIHLDGDQIPLIIKEISPKVKGVIVVAEGADNIKTKIEIINAVSVLLEINAEQITVLTRSKAK